MDTLNEPAALVRNTAPSVSVLSAPTAARDWREELLERRRHRQADDAERSTRHCVICIFIYLIKFNFE